MMCDKPNIILSSHPTKQGAYKQQKDIENIELTFIYCFYI